MFTDQQRRGETGKNRIFPFRSADPGQAERGMGVTSGRGLAEESDALPGFSAIRRMCIKTGN